MTTQEKISAIREECARVNLDIEKEQKTAEAFGDALDSLPCDADEAFGEIPELGRPIRLADVLLAIKQMDIDMEKKIEDVSGRGGAACANLRATLLTFASMTDIRKEFWNFRADDLTLQESATIDFIHSVLFGV